jgi:hypothetical protein
MNQICWSTVKQGAKNLTMHRRKNQSTRSKMRTQLQETKRKIKGKYDWGWTQNKKYTKKVSDLRKAHKKNGQHTQGLKIDFPLKLKQVYNRSTKFTALPPSFDCWNLAIVHGTLLL